MNLNELLKEEEELRKAITSDHGICKSLYDVLRANAELAAETLKKLQQEQKQTQKEDKQ